MEPVRNWELLDCATLSGRIFLVHSNAHEHAFSGLAELVDNGRDADAGSLHINFEKLNGQNLLTVMDDGQGMTRKEMVEAMCFGKSAKEFNYDMVGQYGIGLKSGTMRLGKDALVLTKKGNQQTVLLISQTLNENVDGDKCFVPMATFYDNQTSLTNEEMAKREAALEVLFEISPFNDEEDLLRKGFNRMGASGTRVIVFNLRSHYSGMPELSLNEDEDDIIVTGSKEDNEVCLRKTSLRFFLRHLYMETKMRIFINRSQVYNPPLLYTLAETKQFILDVELHKETRQKNISTTERAIKVLDLKIAELQSQLLKSISPEEIRQKKAEQLKAEENRSRMMKELSKLSNKSAPKFVPVKVFAGINVCDRGGGSGCWFYSRGRLILSSIPTLSHKLAKKGKSNSTVFTSDLDLRNLLKKMNEVVMGFSQGVIAYWKNPVNWYELGYSTDSWEERQLRTRDVIRRIYTRLEICRQCAACGKWRVFPAHADSELPPFEGAQTWQCRNLSTFATCESKQERTQFLLGTLLTEGPEDRKQVLKNKVAAKMNPGVKYQEARKKALAQSQSGLPTEVTSLFVSCPNRSLETAVEPSPTPSGAGESSSMSERDGFVKDEVCFTARGYPEDDAEWLGPEPTAAVPTRNRVCRYSGSRSLKRRSTKASRGREKKKRAGTQEADSQDDQFDVTEPSAFEEVSDVIQLSSDEEDLPQRTNKESMQKKSGEKSALYEIPTDRGLEVAIRELLYAQNLNSSSGAQKILHQMKSLGAKLGEADKDSASEADIDSRIETIHEIKHEAAYQRREVARQQLKREPPSSYRNY